MIPIRNAYFSDNQKKAKSPKFPVVKKQIQIGFIPKFKTEFISGVFLFLFLVYQRNLEFLNFCKREVYFSSSAGQ